MRLLYVIHQFFPDCHSGTEQYCLAIAREARRRGDEVTVLSLHWESHLETPPVRLFEQPYDGFRVLRLNHGFVANPNPELRDYENLHLEGWFRRVLDDVRPDAVHFFHLRQLGSNLLRVAKNLGHRTVVSLTDFWFLCPRFTLLRADGQLCSGPPDGGKGCVACHAPELQGVAAASGPAEPRNEPTARLRALLDRPQSQWHCLQLADAVFAPSHFLAEMFRRNDFAHPGLQVVPYGLEPGRVSAIEVDRPRNPLRLGFCGVLSPWKAPHLAIAALRHLGPEVELRIHGRLEEPMFAAYIEGLRAAASRDPRVQLLGAYSASEVSRVFADLDAVVVPSTWYENTPFVALEALAAGLPVIASDLGGLKEVVTEGVNGALFTPGDAESLALAIERIRTAYAAGGRFAAAPRDIRHDYDAFAAAYRNRDPKAASNRRA